VTQKGSAPDYIFFDKRVVLIFQLLSDSTAGSFLCHSCFGGVVPGACAASFLGICHVEAGNSFYTIFLVCSCLIRSKHFTA
jgi:hypothetical protein